MACGYSTHRGQRLCPGQSSTSICSTLRPPLAATTLILLLPLFLPQSLAFDFQGLPSLSKETITYLGVLLAMLIYRPRLLARARPGRGPELLVVALVACGFGTVLTNRDPLVYGPTVKPGLDLWGALATSFEDVVLAANLGKVAPAEVVARFEKIVAMEESGLTP